MLNPFDMVFRLGPFGGVPIVSLALNESEDAFIVVGYRYLSCDYFTAIWDGRSNWWTDGVYDIKTLAMAVASMNKRVKEK